MSPEAAARLPPAPSEDRARQLVVRWLRAELGVADGRRAVLVGAERPEGRLLAAWGRVEGFPLEAAPGGPGLLHEIAALPPEVMAVAPLHESLLLLDGAVPALLPLGDLWGSWIAEWTGACTLPAAVPDPHSLERVEAALHAGLDEGLGIGPALRLLEPALAESVDLHLRRAARTHRPAVPKLGRWTAGLDPSPG